MVVGVEKVGVVVEVRGRPFDLRVGQLRLRDGGRRKREAREHEQDARALHTQVYAGQRGFSPRSRSLPTIHVSLAEGAPEGGELLHAERFPSARAVDAGLA